MKIEKKWRTKWRRNYIKNTCYILQCIVSASFMASSLLNLFNNLSEGTYRIKCKLKKCKNCGPKYTSITIVFLNT